MFTRYGYPRAILSDNGPQFTGKLWADACIRWGVELCTTPIYHPQANPTERRNQELKKGMRLRLYIKPHRNWDQDVSDILFNLQNRRNAATGKTPSQVLFGQSLKKPGEWAFPETKSKIPQPRSEDPQEQIRNHQDTYLQKKYHPRSSQPPRFKVGDRVFIRNHVLSDKERGINAGLAPKWHGPFPIMSQLGGEVYLLQLENRRTKIDGTQMRPFYPYGQKVLIRKIIRSIAPTFPGVDSRWYPLSPTPPRIYSQWPPPSLKMPRTYPPAQRPSRRWSLLRRSSHLLHGVYSQRPPPSLKTPPTHIPARLLSRRWNLSGSPILHPSHLPNQVLSLVLVRSREPVSRSIQTKSLRQQNTVEGGP